MKHEQAVYCVRLFSSGTLDWRLQKMSEKYAEDYICSRMFNLDMKIETITFYVDFIFLAFRHFMFVTTRKLIRDLTRFDCFADDKFDFRLGRHLIIG